MEAGDDIENGDDARNIGAVGRDHQADQPVAPQQHGGEDGQTGKDHQEQQRASLRSVSLARRAHRVDHGTHGWPLLPHDLPPPACKQASRLRLSQTSLPRSADGCPQSIGKISRFSRRRPACSWQQTAVLLSLSANSWGDRMRLVFQLVARLLIVVILCLMAATVWATIDAYRSVDRATAASADRVAEALQALYWRELLLRSSRMREHLIPAPAWRTTETMKLISPGICVQFEPKAPFEKPLCGQSQGLGKAAPTWFATAVQTLLGSHAAVARPVSARATAAGIVAAKADPDAAIRLAWGHILDNIGVALLMATAIALLASLAIAHTLAPARSIVAALQRMARGQYRTPLPRFHSVELAMIGQAVSELGDR